MALPTPVNGQITDAAAPLGADAPVSMEIRQLLGTIYEAATNCLVAVMYSQTAVMGPSEAAARDVEAGGLSDSAGLARTLSKNLPDAVSQVLSAPGKATVDQLEHVTIADAEDWSAGVREVLSTFKKEIWELHELGRAAGMDLIKQTALDQVLKQMVAAPERFEQLEKIAQFIRALQ